MSHSHYRSTTVLFYALLAGQIFFCLVVVYLVMDYGPRPEADAVAISPLYALLAVVTTAAGAYYMNQLRTRQAAQLRINLDAKLLHYRTTVILRSAIMEAGNFLALTMALLLMNMQPLLFFALGLLIFLYFRPREDEVIRTYRLTNEEQRQLRGEKPLMQ